MKRLLKSINNVFAVGLLAFSLVGGFLFNVELMNQKADAAFYAVQSPATTLYSGIASGATSARLRSFVDIGANKLTMAMFGSVGYVTFEPGLTGKEEVVSFTGITDNGDGTQTITGLSRGLYSRYPFGAGGTARSHGSNTFVVVSNSGEFYNQLAIKSNAETITGVWTFNSWALPKVNSSTTDAMLIASGTSTLATLNYVNGVALSGAPNSTVAVKGVVEMATLAEASSTTALAEIGRAHV